MKALVLGGAGFIGSHLCDRLARENFEVTSFDNFSTGKRENIKEKMTIIEGDVFNDIPQDRYDWIFNLACPASPIAYQKDPIKTALTNSIGAMASLILAQQTNARVFQASTSEVYGDPTISPQHEDYWGNVNPIGVRACYDEGKRFAETLFYDYRRVHNADIRVGRIFNTYGPRMGVDDGRVVSNFIVSALRGDPITIYGNGMQTRSFCYVDDTVDGIIKLMKSDETRPVNIGNDFEMPIVTLADLIIGMTKSKSEFVRHPLPEDDPTQRRPDLKRARDIGWQPTTILYDGLEKTIKYFRGVI
jgi:UDP-glucuronate decarboxylase